MRTNRIIAIIIMISLYLFFKIPLHSSKSSGKISIYSLQPVTTRKNLFQSHILYQKENKKRWKKMWRTTKWSNHKNEKSYNTSSLANLARTSILVLLCFCFSSSTASIVSIIVVCSMDACRWTKGELKHTWFI